MKNASRSGWRSWRGSASQPGDARGAPKPSRKPADGRSSALATAAQLEAGSFSSVVAPTVVPPTFWGSACSVTVHLPAELDLGIVTVGNSHVDPHEPEKLRRSSACESSAPGCACGYSERLALGMTSDRGGYPELSSDRVVGRPPRGVAASIPAVPVDRR